ncbi:isoleucine--tRNA ligase [Phaeovibrio sulfidiphilus]|uniref:Isoleucine--tRNA ligase n=1 Tax=Phaeovibrio sulfidiphilus TaxID=1220600 RepID=A0A8J6YM80_9PROT|nr:isoleucine--tRNA ligase [Phaeovibrio sulfidiphilus]MBE1236414.1 isoleucine--tRNA ligase [Phaeovibrio sulfidiphilus]
MSADYKSTVFLPKTSFPMKAGLPQKEPELLARWEAMDLYTRLRHQSRDRERFVLHDGPPYANAHLHNGHALNKILKDVINRFQQMSGKDANYVPGWDCHGLPIEWKIEEEYRKKGQNKDQVDIVDFRRECRAFAEHWIDIQREEFKRLGVLGDWKDPYITMSFAAESRILREMGRFLMDGSLYRGARPVLWSVAEKTALADAEVEYHDLTSTTIWIRFPVIAPSQPALEGASVVIWTTTPWTMPGNRAVAYGEDMDYVLFRVDEVAEGSLAVPGERLVVGRKLLEDVLKQAGITAHTEEASFRGRDLAGTVARHPWRGRGYDFDVPLLAGSFVTDDSGTGFVHIAPGHGEDDYVLGRANGLPVPDTVDGSGNYVDSVPLFAGRNVFKVAPEILEAMREVGALLAHGTLVHSYPHSWRSKAPLIFRNTPQWFISMETLGLRDKALEAIDATRWVPERSKNRIRSMVEARPDWCISRQRMWGVPLAIFLHKETLEPLRDQGVIDRIAEAFEKEGGDAWFTGDPKRFLGPEHDPDLYEPVRDIIEVWFDSGSTHAFVLEQRDDLKWPADLYLEGSDQHRGWFHTSLLEAVGTRGRAPYDAVLTHGFLLDEKGEKFSKSKGNAESPQKAVDSVGADVLRLWVVSSDYMNDIRYGPEILKQATESYRRLRNTLRFLLGALDGFTAEERIANPDALPELERWVLHRLSELDETVRRSGAALDFHEAFQELQSFCTLDLSAFYLDIRKDVLYCDGVDSARRRACRTVMDRVFHHLVSWLAPFVCFTAEEAWLARHPETDGSIHMETFPEVPEGWRNEALAGRWEAIRRVRRVVTGALERARADRMIGSSLQARVDLYLPQTLADGLQGLDLADLFIVSGVALHEGAAAPGEAFRLEDVEGVAVVVEVAPGEKCERCWKVLPDVGTNGYDGLCGRCSDVIASGSYPASAPADGG